MEILFITLYDMRSIHNRGIYEDLLREFIKRGHRISVISPLERKNKEKTHVIQEKKCRILKVKVGNIQKTNLIEKGIATILLETQFISALKKHYSNVKFDMVLYSTPPITIDGAVEFVKKRDKAMTYLLLKDIFPQNAVDIGMINKTGVKGILYKYFRKKEKNLYYLSDYIGCMSGANVNYILNHNPEIEKQKVEVCPNSIEPRDMSVTEEKKIFMRRKYGIPIDKKVFVYGGNLGKPQGIQFLIECLDSQKNREDVFFLIVGSGTEYKKIQNYITKAHPPNVKLLEQLQKEDYDQMIGSCDIGLIFLDHRFTIPNFPSRLLSYMQAKLPVLAVTDPNTDVGEIIETGKFGWWCESDSVEKFENILNKLLNSTLKEESKNSWEYLERNYSAGQGCEKILQHLVQ